MSQEQKRQASFEEQISAIAGVATADKPRLAFFNKLPGETDRNKAIYLLLTIGLSAERVADITGLSTSTIERRIKNGF